jgi:hypothetical protein
MLWYKSWMETRWRFLIGLALLVLNACGTVWIYPHVVNLLPTVQQNRFGGDIGRKLNEAMDLARNYRGYVWSQWFRSNLLEMWTLFAVLLGAGSLRSQASEGGALFTLSLPVTRNRLLGVRAGAALAELLLLAVVPSILLPVLSAAIGQSYSIGDALIHALCMFIAGTVFFALTLLLSTAFNDIWRPLLIGLCAAVALRLASFIPPFGDWFGLFPVMTAENYFRNGALPWLGLVISTAASVALLYAAARNLKRQDF